MNKNTVIGFVLIGVILFGYTWYQSKQYEKQAAVQAKADSLARVERLMQMKADSAAGLFSLDTLTDENAVPSDVQAIYKDSLLERAYNSDSSLLSIENDRVAIVFTTKGAQPYSVKVKGYRNYDSTDLYLFKEGESRMGYSIYAGESINTADFVFNVAEKTDSSVVMRLPFRNGGYIEQSFALEGGSYVMKNCLSFVGMNGIIPRNVSYYDFDWDVTVPRMEKGYRNETQYSKIDYYFGGDKRPEEN